MRTYLVGIRWQGARHEVAPATRQERRVRRLVAIAARAHRAAASGLDGFNARAIELHGSQPEPNQKGLRPWG